MSISPERSVAMSIEDSKALSILEQNAKLVDGRYEVPMLWKNSSLNLPNDVEMVWS